ncbi:FMN-dependent oxidoreductase (nitrilotriacetate monooxygenase family) [Microbacterium terrae]|uniref:Nitrilotriacetate monooxygenase component A n=1 Tax=Microbacterium terrae TaxID=69369 RepID=A0A0M2HKD4_9MICO|nr:NtaA/DmoA family FMN-dependent monooxygenase [Microbacterium terrae]KJL45327.1 Nitrilotriacetate monooxygenase component A [Microbacterium terrae]MBP1078425.1 FMN-dependent oxidoreductase (nitrilotriacetate monooxygenase family) [Microbacterium terrae]GLJ99325.1 nitrilotriacetate monooxygenase [Microbacterium terrae]
MTTFHLNISLQTPGHVRTAWRLPERDPRAWIDVGRLRELTRAADRAKLHAVFLGDAPGLGTGISAHPEAGLDPTILFADLLAGTSGIGAIATSSSTYNSPYNLARRYLALDHVTGGRAALNIVTTFAPHAAAAYGYSTTPDKVDRYRRADEFLQVVLGLWDGWDADALVADPRSGLFAQADGIHRVDHDGEFFRVRGALSVPPSPQHRPVLVQAGGSPGGLQLAARWAEVVFTAGQDIEEAAAFRRGTKSRAHAAGRDPRGIVTSLGVVVLVADTERAVRSRVAALVDTIDLDAATRGIAAQLGLDADRVTPDTVLTADVLDGAPLPPASAGFHRSTRALVATSPLTVRELVTRSATGSGHRLLAGTPEQIADDLERWYRAGAADGFTIMPADIAEDFHGFTDEVVPILQARGLFQRDHRAPTLRENLGLDALAPGADRARIAGGLPATA